MSDEKPKKKVEAPSVMDQIRLLLRKLAGKDMKDRHRSTYGGVHAEKVTGTER